MSNKVRCPKCFLTLEIPGQKFRCPCGTVLTAPNGRTELKYNQNNENESNNHQNYHAYAKQNGIQKDKKTDLLTSVANSVNGLYENVKFVALERNKIQRDKNQRQSAEEPPIETLDSSRKDCEICETQFTLFYRKHHCRACGALICKSCSPYKWPVNMLPESFNIRKERGLLRICKNCHSASDRFRTALLNGNLKSAQNEFNSGQVRTSTPYSIYPNSQYPAHCAVAGGSIPLISWLIRIGCPFNVLNAQSISPLGEAVSHGKIEIIRLLISNNLDDLRTITDCASLQKCLLIALGIYENGENKENDYQNHYTSHPLIQSNNLPPPSYESTLFAAPAPSLPKTTFSAPIPKNETEEEEQMRIAVAASRDCENNIDISSFRNFDDDKLQKLNNEEETSKDTNHQQKNDSSECIICFDASVNTVFIPCGHSCCCLDCSSQFSDQCPVCRVKIEQTIRTYNMSNTS